ncbi:hypothetical protein Q8G71_34460, partial [Klebsiella pneumoniae]
IAPVSNNPVVGGAIRKEDLKLVRGTDGLIRLSVYSPAIDAAISPLLALDDMDGQMRYAPDVGADEYSPGRSITNQPLTTVDVGPQALMK